MQMTQEDEIERLQLEMYKDPRSGHFIRLAELYLSKEMVTEAALLIQDSLKFHSNSVSGLVLMGRCHKKLKNYELALTPLLKATELAPENWRAWLELAETYIELKVAKKAFLAFKKVLFLNPTHPSARKAVAKLEVLTADEYEDDLFEMQKLPDAEFKTEAKPLLTEQWTTAPDGLVRILSYIDALIIRQDHKKAIELLNDCTVKYGHHPEIETRRLKLSVYENADFIKPKSLAEASMSKREIINEKKLKTLQELLRRIESFKSESLST